MENLKIDLCGLTDKEKQNAVWLLNDLGFSTGFKSIDFYSYLYGCVGLQAPYDKTIQFGNSSKTFSRNTGKEITLPELRDLVVLKRNDVGNATHINFRTNTPFLVQGSKEYFHLNNKWILSDSVNDLKPIEKKEMKEYLVKTDSGDYLYAKNVSDIEASRVIEIPEGVNIYARCNIFGDCKLLPHAVDGDWEILWQRETLNDKVASGESYSSMSQTTFIERELCKSSLNYTVANAFRAIRSDVVRLTEDDVRLIQELTELAKAHGDVWK